MKILVTNSLHNVVVLVRSSLVRTSPSQYRQQIPHMFFLRRFLFEFPFEINQASRRPDENTLKTHKNLRLLLII